MISEDIKGSKATDLEIWLKPEVFSFGSVPVTPPSKLALNNIKRIVNYVKLKDEANFPILQYSLWKYIAKRKMDLPEDVSSMYFENYCQLLKCRSYDQRRIFYDNIAVCKSSRERQELRNHWSANVYEFVLLLYIQFLHKVSAKNAIRLGEEHPSYTSLRSPSPELDSATPIGRSRSSDSLYKRNSKFKPQDELEALTFVKNNLNSILELLIDTEITDSSGPYLCMDGVRALSFLFACQLRDRSKIWNLDELALEAPFTDMNGFSKQCRLFKKSAFEHWISTYLRQNPYSFANCLSDGSRLNWVSSLVGTDAYQGGQHSARAARVATNAVRLPKDAPDDGYKLIGMIRCSRMVLVRSKGAGLLPHSSVRIHGSNNAFIYLLTPLRSVCIERCQYTTFVLGPVETALYLNGCDYVTVIAPCFRAYIGSSSNCTLHLLTNTPSLLLGQNEGITFAPYNTHYPQLLEQLKEAGISENWNLWNQPLLMQPKLRDQADAIPTWRTMEPAFFYPFAIPFHMSDGSCSKLPGTLPREYAVVLFEREQLAKQWQHSIRQANLTPEQRAKFKQYVTERFQEWLSYMGYNREIELLHAMEQQSLAKKEPLPNSLTSQA